jgi:hypothetical protein
METFVLPSQNSRRQHAIPGTNGGKMRVIIILSIYSG